MNVARTRASNVYETEWLPVVHDVVVEPSLGILTCRLQVPRELPIFAGHFPNIPIVPGVVQLGWVIAMARAYGLVSGEFVGITTVKFRRLLRPGADINVRIEPGHSRGQVKFEFHAEAELVSCGRLRFGDLS